MSSIFALFCCIGFVQFVFLSQVGPRDQTSEVFGPQRERFSIQTYNARYNPGGGSLATYNGGTSNGSKKTSGCLTPGQPRGSQDNIIFE